MNRYRAVSLPVAAAWAALALLPADAADLTVYFGTHTAGPGKGFSVSHFDTATGALTKPEFLLETPAPAYYLIAPGGRRLYSCNSTGFVSAYSIDPATAQLKLINQKPSGGGDPSYISLDQTGHYVLVANFASGNVAVWALAPDGSLGERTAFVQHADSSANSQQPLQPHAHSIRVDPSNRFALVGDTGLDKLFIYKFNVKDGSLAPNDPPFVTAAPGANPRHVAFHPNGRWLYVLTEAGSTIMLFNWDTRRGARPKWRRCRPCRRISRAEARARRSRSIRAASSYTRRIAGATVSPSSRWTQRAGG